MARIDDGGTDHEATVAPSDPKRMPRATRMLVAASSMQPTPVRGPCRSSAVFLRRKTRKFSRRYFNFSLGIAYHVLLLSGTLI